MKIIFIYLLLNIFWGFAQEDCEPEYSYVQAPPEYSCFEGTNPSHVTPPGILKQLWYVASNQRNKTRAFNFAAERDIPQENIFEFNEVTKDKFGIRNGYGSSIVIVEYKWDEEKEDIIPVKHVFRSFKEQDSYFKTFNTSNFDDLNIPLKNKFNKNGFLIADEFDLADGVLDAPLTGGAGSVLKTASGTQIFLAGTGCSKFGLVNVGASLVGKFGVKIIQTVADDLLAKGFHIKVQLPDKYKKFYKVFKDVEIGLRPKSISAEDLKQLKYLTPLQKIEKLFSFKNLGTFSRSDEAFNKAVEILKNSMANEDQAVLKKVYNEAAKILYHVKDDSKLNGMGREMREIIRNVRKHMGAFEKAASYFLNLKVVRTFP